MDAQAHQQEVVRRSLGGCRREVDAMTERLDALARLESEHRFRIGQRVRLSPQGHTSLGFRKRGPNGIVRGTVTALGPTLLGVSVHVDGYAKPSSFFVGFWEATR
jgi:hypothetical protein